MATNRALPFGDACRALRLAAGLTQEALAERAGISARSIRALETGRSMPYKDTVRRLVAALGLSGADAARLIAAATPSRGAGYLLAQHPGPRRFSFFPQARHPWWAAPLRWRW